MNRDIPQPPGPRERPLSTYEELDHLRAVLGKSRDKLKAVFDAINDPVISFTPQGRVESVNLAMAEFSGRHPRELVGLPGEEVMGLARLNPRLQATVEGAFARMLAENSPQHRLVEPSAEEAEGRHFEVSVTPAHGAEGELVLAIVQVKDVTLYKRMEETIREYSQGLEQEVARRTGELTRAQESLKQEKERLAAANQELMRLDKLRQDLTRMVVHDLKGPLFEVMGNLDLLGYETLSETQLEAKELAELGAGDLLRMIMNLLDIGRLEEGRLAVRKTPLIFADLAARVRDRFRTLIRLKGLAISLQDDLGGPLAGDGGLLERVLQNLFTNAINHTPEGGAISISAERNEDGEALISVIDSGEGIPSGAERRIFRKFTQAGQDQPKGSTGLGLAFCRLAVEAHGGRIWVENPERGGAAFYFTLPGD